MSKIGIKSKISGKETKKKECWLFRKLEEVAELLPSHALSNNEKLPTATRSNELTEQYQQVLSRIECKAEEEKWEAIKAAANEHYRNTQGAISKKSGIKASFHFSFNSTQSNSNAKSLEEKTNCKRFLRPRSQNKTRAMKIRKRKERQDQHTWAEASNFGWASVL